jgi:hypothetical protein
MNLVFYIIRKISHDDLRIREVYSILIQLPTDRYRYKCLDLTLLNRAAVRRDDDLQIRKSRTNKLQTYIYLLQF